MGFEEEYEKLDSDDKSLFKRCVNTLLRHTFILPQQYDLDNGVRKGNPEHAFAFRSFSLLSDYFSYMGVSLEKNEEFSLIYIRDNSGQAPVRFNLLTTQILLTLRLIYDEERKNLSFSSDVKITIAELVQRLQSLAAMKRHLSMSQVADSLRQISHFRIITKQSGAYLSGTTEILIHPTILFIVSQERLETLSRLIEEKSDESEQMIEEEEDNDEEIE